MTEIKTAPPVTPDNLPVAQDLVAKPQSKQPTAQKIGEIREGIEQYVPLAERVIKRTNPEPPKREVINVAGELYRKQKEMEAQQEIDPLTGLLNDKGFDRRMDEKVAEAKRSGRKLAVVFFDLNRLKKVNDELGHDVGDEYIKTGADILSSSFRPGDVISRRGAKADEFMVGLEIDDMEQVKALYARINEAVGEANQNWEGYPILFPAGAVEVQNGNVNGAIREADQAMYAAKDESREIGKNVLSVSGVS